MPEENKNYDYSREERFVLMEIIDTCVDQIWSKYDTDGNGTLNEQETKRFIVDNIEEMTGKNKVWTDNDVELCYQEFD